MNIVVDDIVKLVIELKKGSEKVFLELYDCYFGVLNGVIFWFILDVDVVEDVLQDMFVKIW